MSIISTQFGKIDPSNKRQMAGLRLAGAGRVQQTARNDFFVRSDSGKSYEVLRNENAESEEMWECECPDFTHRQVDCKHIHAAKIYAGAISRYDSTVRRLGKPLTDLEVSVMVHAMNTYAEYQDVRLNLRDAEKEELEANGQTYDW